MYSKIIKSAFLAASVFLCTSGVGFAQDSQGSEESAETTRESQRSGLSAEAVSPFIEGDGLSNNAVNPDIDTFLVKCLGKTTICADVDANGFNINNPPTHHVSIICIAPAARKGRAQLEYGLNGFASDDACVSDCQEAVVSLQCEFNDACVGNYDTVIQCQGKDFAPGFPKQVS